MAPVEVQRPILEWLLRPLDRSERDAAMAQLAGNRGWVAYTARRQAEGADPETIRFVKHRERDAHHVCAVTWIDGEGLHKEGVFSVVADPSGAYSVAGSHYGGAASFPVHRPWLNAGGGGRPLYIGGRVMGTTQTAGVRVTLPDGIPLEDSVDESGWALFPTAYPRLDDSIRSGIVEVLDASGALLNRHRLFGNSEPV